METRISIPGIGDFEAEYYASGHMAHYTVNRLLNGTNVNYIIFPKENGTCYTEAEKQQIARRVKFFDARVGHAIRTGVNLIRQYWEGRESPIHAMSDDEVAGLVVLSNAKLEPEGEYESYCREWRFHPYLDLVLRFDEQMNRYDAYFDG